MLDTLINVVIVAIWINLVLIVASVLFQIARQAQEKNAGAVDTPQPASLRSNTRSRPERNYPLLIGGTLSLIFVLIAIFGPSMAPKDPMAVSGRHIVDGQTYLRPYRPLTPGYPLGSDEVGRDILSRLLWAVRPTLLMAAVVVAVRLSIGLPLGLLAGWYRGWAERSIGLVVSVSLAIPSLIFSIAVIGFLGIYRGVWVFLLALCLTGWADVTSYVKDQTLSLLKAPYIESARAVGVRNLTILRRYILPQLWPILPAIIAFELSAVVLLIAELGFLGFYIGGGEVFARARGDTPAMWMVLTSGYPELGQLISDVWAKVIQVPWLLLFVSIIILLLVFAFNMLGEGLRRAMDITRPSRFRLRLSRPRRRRRSRQASAIQQG